MLKFGTVTEVKPGDGTARVEFREDGIVSPWMSIVVPCTKADKYQYTPAIGEHVVCLMEGDGSAGVILGAKYSTVNTPAADLAHDDRAGVEFADGTQVYYDQGAGELVVDSVGKVKVIAASEFSATVGSAELKATTAGLTLKFGADSVKTILTDILNASIAETHPTPAGPSSVPTNVADYVAALVKVNTIFVA